MISILNNPASLAAQNQMAVTSGQLQKTLFQLSSGSRINSGADDAAGLAIANGLQANITALTQSARNANDGVGKLQVADGALAQVTTLLNRAVTLATEAATGTVSQSQRQALNNEFTAIKAEVDRIGNATNFNGNAIFSSATAPNTNELVGNAGSLTLGTALTSGDITSFTAGGKTFTFTAGASSTVGDLINAINNPATDPAGLTAYIGTTGATAGQLVVVDPNNNNNVAVGSTMNETKLGLFTNPTGAGSSQTNIFLSDGNVSSAYNTISVNIGQLDSSHIGTASIGSDVLYSATGDAASITAAQGALTDVNSAISQVASLRGGIGAGINRLQSATNVINNQVQNLTSAEDGITAADIPSAVANLTKYSILEQTGVSALAQSNQMQQLVLKLIQ